MSTIMSNIQKTILSNSSDLNTSKTLHPSIQELQSHLLNLWTSCSVDQTYQNLFLVFIQSFQQPKEQIRQIEAEIKKTYEKNSLYFLLQENLVLRVQIKSEIEEQIVKETQAGTIKKPNKVDIVLRQLCDKLKNLRRINLLISENILKIFEDFKVTRQNSIGSLGKNYIDIFMKIDVENEFIKESFLNEYILFQKGYDPFFLVHYEQTKKSQNLFNLKKHEPVSELFEMNISYVYRLMRAQQKMLKYMLFIDDHAGTEKQRKELINRQRLLKIANSNRNNDQIEERDQDNFLPPISKPGERSRTQKNMSIASTIKQFMPVLQRKPNVLRNSYQLNESDLGEGVRKKIYSLRPVDSEEIHDSMSSNTPKHFSLKTRLPNQSLITLSSPKNQPRYIKPLPNPINYDTEDDMINLVASQRDHENNVQSQGDSRHSGASSQKKWNIKKVMKDRRHYLRPVRTQQFEDDVIDEEEENENEFISRNQNHFQSDYPVYVSLKKSKLADSEAEEITKSRYRIKKDKLRQGKPQKQRSKQKDYKKQKKSKKNKKTRGKDSSDSQDPKRKSKSKRESNAKKKNKRRSSSSDQDDKKHKKKNDYKRDPRMISSQYSSSDTDQQSLSESENSSLQRKKFHRLSEEGLNDSQSSSQNTSKQSSSSQREHKRKNKQGVKSSKETDKKKDNKKPIKQETQSDQEISKKKSSNPKKQSQKKTSPKNENQRKSALKNTQKEGEKQKQKIQQTNKTPKSTNFKTQNLDQTEDKIKSKNQQISKNNRKSQPVEVGSESEHSVSVQQQSPQANQKGKSHQLEKSSKQQPSITETSQQRSIKQKEPLKTQKVVQSSNPIKLEQPNKPQKQVPSLKNQIQDSASKSQSSKTPNKNDFSKKVDPSIQQQPMKKQEPATKVEPPKNSQPSKSVQKQAPQKDESQSESISTQKSKPNLNQHQPPTTSKIKMVPGKLTFAQFPEYIKSKKVQPAYSQKLDESIKFVFNSAKNTQTYLNEFHMNDEIAVVALCSPTVSGNIVIYLWMPIEKVCDEKTSQFFFKKYLDYLEQQTTCKSIVYSGTEIPELAKEGFVFQKDKNHVKKRVKPVTRENFQFESFFSMEASNICFVQTTADSLFFSDEIEPLSQQNSWCNSAILNAKEQDVQEQLDDNWSIDEKIKSLLEANKILQKDSYDTFQVGEEKIIFKDINMSRSMINCVPKLGFIANDGFMIVMGKSIDINDPKRKVNKIEMMNDVCLYIGSGFKHAQQMAESLGKIKDKAKQEDCKFAFKMFSKQVYGKYLVKDPKLEKGKAFYCNWDLNFAWRDEIPGKIIHDMTGVKNKYGPQNFVCVVEMKSILTIALEIEKQDFLY